MSVILTNQFNRSDDIVAANQVAAIQEQAGRTGQPPAALPPQALTPDFLQKLAQDLSHSYFVVYAVAVSLALLVLIPASFLPKKPVAAAPGQPPVPALAH